MEINEVFKKVSKVIENSIGAVPGSIQLDDTLFGKLGIDSIDLVDILFELETAYNTQLKVSDVEKRVREEMAGRPYEIDGVITSEGLESLRKYMTEVDSSHFVEGLTVHQLVRSFTVHSLCKLIIFKFEEDKKQADG